MQCGCERVVLASNLATIFADVPMMLFSFPGKLICFSSYERAYVRIWAKGFEKWLNLICQILAYPFKIESSFEYLMKSYFFIHTRAGL